MLSRGVLLVLLSEAFTRYRDDVIVLSGQSIRTEQGFLVTQRIFVSFVGDIAISTLTHRHIRDFHTSLVKRGLARNTIRGYLFHIKAVIEYASASESVIDHKLITIPKREVTIPDYLTPEQVEKLINSIVISQGCHSEEAILRDRAIVSMLYASGLRASELCKLNKEDWDKQRATVIGKGGVPRLVFWDDRTTRLLKDYLDIRTDDHEAMFVTADSDGSERRRIRRQSLTRLFVRLQKKTGLDKAHAHALRHGFATNLMQNGMHIYTISKLMGHSNIQTTQQYLHVSDPLLEEEYARYHSV